MPRKRIGAVAIGALVVGLLAGLSGTATANPRLVVITYDAFEAPGGYTLTDYLTKWSNPFGPGEMGLGDTRDFGSGAFAIDAAPFQTGVDFSVFDHIKYFAASNESFPVPAKGSVTFSIDIGAETPGTQPGRIIHGAYGPPGSCPSLPCPAALTPYAEPTLEGQQAGATLHMIDFASGQLFDWFVSGSTAFALIERLPATIVGPGGGTPATMYTQIIKEVPISAGPHTVAIRLWRDAGKSYVDYLLDGKRVARVEKVGIPLDVQGVKYSGIYPSLGPGELLGDRIDSVTIGHGLFSLLDAFPFQHEDVPELSVSIPVSERLFGQGARATFDNVIVTIDARG